MKNLGEIKKEESGSKLQPKDDIIMAEAGSLFVPWQQRHKLLLRIIASIVVVAFVFTQTGISQAATYDRNKINPSQVTKERTGFLGLEAFQENKKIEQQELEQRRKVEQQRAIEIGRAHV